MFWNKKKDDANADEPVVNNPADDGKDKINHAMGDGDAVPQALKDTLAKIRGQEESDYDEVEVDDDGNPIKNEDGTLRIVKEDEASGTDGGSLGDSEDGRSEPEGDEDASEYQEVELDPRLEAAGKAMGWSEDKIRRVAEADITVLEDLANRLDKSDTHQQNKEEAEGTADAQAAEDPVLTKLKEKFGEDANDILVALSKGIEKKFADKFKDVDDFRTATQKESERRTLIQKFDIASEVFDKHADQFQTLGKTDALPKKDGQLLTDSPAMKERNKVYEVAEMFHATRGGTFERAMEDAMNWYAGTQGQTLAVRRVVKDLNERKRYFTPKPTKRKTMKVFKTPDDKAANIVREAKKAAGIE